MKKVFVSYEFSYVYGGVETQGRGHATLSGENIKFEDLSKGIRDNLINSRGSFDYKIIILFFRDLDEGNEKPNMYEERIENFKSAIKKHIESIARNEHGPYVGPKIAPWEALLAEDSRLEKESSGE